MVLNTLQSLICHKTKTNKLFNPFLGVGVLIFPKGISRKVNVKPQLEFLSLFEMEGLSKYMKLITHIFITKSGEALNIRFWEKHQLIFKNLFENFFLDNLFLNLLIAVRIKAMNSLKTQFVLIALSKEYLRDINIYAVVLNNQIFFHTIF